MSKQSKQQELNKIYHHELTTDRIKNIAWDIRGVSSQHFNLNVRGGKGATEESIGQCLQALKQAYLNDKADLKHFYKEYKIK